MKRKNESEVPLQKVNSVANSNRWQRVEGIKKSEGELPDKSIEFIATEDKDDLNLSLLDNKISPLKNLINLEQRVREKTTELEAFTQTVSHDLRAPIRCIDRFSQVLLKDYNNILDDTGKKYLKTINKSAQHMGNLVEILLSFFFTGHKELDKTELNIENIIDDIINEQKIYTQNELNFIHKEILLPVFGDRSLIKLALSNLISNAVKFSKNQSSPEIIIGSYTAKDEIIYFIKDNGAGFNMEHSEKLFCAFQRLHKSDEFEGTGIGLNIVERVINRHGGRVWAESKIDEGAVFYFSIPIYS